LHERDHGGRTILHWEKLVPEVKLLLENGANVHAKDKYGCTPLLWHCVMGVSLETVKLMVEHGAETNVCTDSGVPVLGLAVAKCSAQVVGYLLEKGAASTVNTADTEEVWTPLHGAAYYDKPDAVALLLQHGADPTLKDRTGKTALDLAIQRNHPSVADLLRA